jgi:hypothetical protein
MSRREATLAACQLRLRPIIMTSFAFILGVVPLIVSEGAGSEMRKTLGTAVFAGMLGVTLFGIFLTPVFYSVIQWFKDRRMSAETEGAREAHGHVPSSLPKASLADGANRLQGTVTSVRLIDGRAELVISLENGQAIAVRNEKLAAGRTPQVGDQITAVIRDGDVSGRRIVGSDG